jgi:hypothetical protein
MSEVDRERLVVLGSVREGLRTQVEASALLGLSTRQVRRLLVRLKTRGDAGLIHGLRGRRSNRCSASGLRDRVVSIYRQDLADYGPTLASERLAGKPYGLVVNRETLRRWLVAEGLWERVRKREVVRHRRPRRACVGEMLQADGSVHDWLEGRGPRCTLLALIDDASSRLLARFYEAETTAGYFDLFGRYVRKYGLPVSVYTDRSGIFRIERKKQRETEVEREPQFARALEQLGVRRIVAYSPQAKGRVERLFGTLQDRWVKGLREAGAKTIEQANRVIEVQLIESFNEKFTVKPASEQNAHRPSPGLSKLEAVLCVHEERKVSNDYTVRHGNRVYQLVKPLPPNLRGSTIMVQTRGDGEVRFSRAIAPDQYLPWRAATSSSGQF